MRLAVSFDQDGTITTLFDPDELRTEQGTLEYLPEEGEEHHLLEVPEEHRATPVHELPEVLRVDLSADRPRLTAKG